MDRTLLYIDPDPATRLLVRKVLAPAGYTVLEADDSRVGLEVLERSRPDLVLVDIDAADAAADLARAVHQLAGTEQLILLASTSEHHPERLTQTMQLGFQGVLMKPLDIDSLAQALGRHVPRPAERPAAGTQLPPVVPDGRIHPFWRPSLGPLLASVVRSAATAYGLLALLDASKETLVLVAAYFLRPAGNEPVPGARIPLDTVSWLRPVLRTRQTLLMREGEVAGASLIPAGSTIVLVAPVVSEERTYGVAILGEQRQRPFGLPEAQVAHCAAEAQGIGAILRAFERRDDSVRSWRRELDRARMAAARAIATGRADDPKTPDPETARRVHLGLGLADRLGLELTERPILEQALEARSIGRLWLRQAVIPLVKLSPGECKAIMEEEVVETCDVLEGLGLPHNVLELIENSRMALRPDRDISLAARIVAVVTAYEGLVESPATGRVAVSPQEAVAELRRTSGDPLGAVVTALGELIQEHSTSP